MGRREQKSGLKPRANEQIIFVEESLYIVCIAPLGIFSLSSFDFGKLVSYISASTSSETLLVCRRSKENWLMPTDGKVRHGRTVRKTCQENIQGEKKSRT